MCDTTNSSYLDSVIKTVKEIVKFSTEFYKEAIIAFLSNYKITAENVDALSLLLQMTQDQRYSYYEITNATITLHREQLTTRQTTDESKHEQSVRKQIQQEDLVSYYSLEQAGILIKKISETETVLQEDYDYSSALDKFNKKFADNGFYHNSKVIQYIIDNASHRDRKYKVFWQEYIRSIVEAEYLSDTEYSKKLKNVIDVIIQFFGGDTIDTLFAGKKQQGETIKSFSIIESFIRISWLVIEFCEKNKKILENTEQKEYIIVNTDRRLRFYRIANFQRIYFDVGKNTTRQWERLLESVIEMTEIDHRYIATNHNIDKLLNLLGRLDFFKDDAYIDKDLFSAIRIKTAVLLNQVLKTRTGCDLVLNEEDGIEKKIEETANQLEPCGYINDENAYKGRIGNPVRIPKTDIDLYDNYVKKGVTQYCEYTPLFRDNKYPTLEKIEEFLNDPNNKYIASQALIIDLFENVYRRANDLLSAENKV
ncbi:MAG: hypothetical protein LBM67_00290 [Lentimicrobiaceae bacterium]|jgi:hypothetical protein|nr:hypothetical protein [Lentimicrobiaceae bacterium]